MADEQTISIQLLLILFLGGIAIRWFFFTSSSSRNSSATSSPNNLRAREADVERVQQMFPQIARRTIMWDLQRNGGNVAATTERILSDGGLETVSDFRHLVVYVTELSSSHHKPFNLQCKHRL